MPARPIKILGSFLKPEIIKAISGGAFTYPLANKITKRTTATTAIATINSVSILFVTPFVILINMYT